MSGARDPEAERVAAFLHARAAGEELLFAYEQLGRTDEAKAKQLLSTAGFADGIDDNTPTPIAPGTNITITGTGLAGTTDVQFNGVAASIVSKTATNVVANCRRMRQPSAGRKRGAGRAPTGWPRMNAVGLRGSR